MKLNVFFENDGAIQFLSDRMLNYLTSNDLTRDKALKFILKKMNSIQ